MSAKRMAIYGKSGSGKSYYLKSIIKDMDRVVVFDPEEEYGELPGFTEVDRLSDLLELLRDCWDTSFRVAYVPSAGREPEDLHKVSQIIERIGEAYKCGKLDKTMAFAVDELNLSFSLTVNTDKLDGFARLCSRGRKRGIHLIGSTQRPAEVSTRFRGNLDRIAVFQLAQKIDVDAAAKAVGDRLYDMLPQCKEHGHVFYENGEINIMPPV